MLEKKNYDDLIKYYNNKLEHMLNNKNNITILPSKLNNEEIYEIIKHQENTKKTYSIYSKTSDI